MFFPKFKLLVSKFLLEIISFYQLLNRIIIGLTFGRFVHLISVGYSSTAAKRTWISFFLNIYFLINDST